MNTTRKVLAGFGALAVFAVGCSSDDEDATDTTTTTEAVEDDAATDAASETADMTIVEIAASNDDFSTLVAAVQAAELDGTLADEAGTFTVFAPTNEAFDAALASLGITAEELLADPTLADILTYHVLPDQVLAEQVVNLDGQEVATVNGATVAISVDGSDVMVNDANVVTTDIVASNGVIHVIDAVLLPPAA